MRINNILHEIYELILLPVRLKQDAEEKHAYNVIRRKAMEDKSRKLAARIKELHNN